MSRSARAGLVVAVGLTVLFLILATLAQTGPLPGEGALAQTFVDHRNAILDAASRLASLPVWTVFVLLVSAGVWRWRGQTAALLVVGAAVSAESVSLLAKILVDRPRPLDAIADDPLTNAAFPSGHVVRTTVTLGMLVALLVWQRPTWRMPVVVAAAGFLALVGAARLASGEHWPLDVLGGYALGTLWLAVLLIARRFRTVPPRGRRGG